jgi:hypothetical protein
MVCLTVALATLFEAGQGNENERHAFDFENKLEKISIKDTFKNSSTRCHDVQYMF